MKEDKFDNEDSAAVRKAIAVKMTDRLGRGYRRALTIAAANDPSLPKTSSQDEKNIDGGVAVSE